MAGRTGPGRSSNTTGRPRSRRLPILPFVVLLLFLLLAYVSISSPQGYMPGPLSDEHQFTGDRCDSCHKPWGDVESGCVNCHNNATLDQGWREHRRTESSPTSGDSVSSGLLSRTVGATGIAGLAATATGTILAFAFAAGRWRRLTSRKGRRRAGPPRER